MKKQLIELFQESFRDDAIDGSQNIQERSKANPIICPLSSKSTNKNLYGCLANFACSSEAIHNRSYNHGKEKFAKSARCCLPNLMRSLSWEEEEAEPCQTIVLETMPSFLLCLYFKELVLPTSMEDINLILKLPFHITWLSSSKLH